MGYRDKYENILTIILILLVSATIVLLIIFPKETLGAASAGVKLWLNTILPSLLPFFIGSELLLGLGVVNFIGVLLEPIMRPVFNVPGAGSFAMAMGFTSGYPMGAKIISRMRQEKLCTKTEAERLMAFCNNSGPLFMIGAVGVGMFKSPLLGYVILISNYLGALTVGIIFRFYKNKREKHTQIKINLKKALKEIIESRKKDGRPFGELLSDSIVSSVNTILMIGGFIVFFSVLIHLLNITGFIYAISKATGIMPAFLSGIVEITVGTYNISISQANAMHKVALAATLIAWGGLSAHAQILSLITKTDMSYSPFLLSKILHAIFAFVYSCIILTYINPDIPVFYTNNNSWLKNLEASSISFIIVILLFSFLGISYHMIKYVAHRTIK